MKLQWRNEKGGKSYEKNSIYDNDVSGICIHFGVLNYIGFFEKTGQAVIGLYIGINSVIFVVALLIIIDVLSFKEVFFFLVRKKYVKTMAVIRKEPSTNIIYNGSQGGYGGYTQMQYKIEYKDQNGKIYKETYTTGMSESKFATLLNWRVGTNLKVLYSPQKPNKVLIDRDYYKNIVKQKIRKMRDDWNEDI